MSLTEEDSNLTETLFAAVRAVNDLHLDQASLKSLQVFLEFNNQNPNTLGTPPFQAELPGTSVDFRAERILGRGNFKQVNQIAAFDGSNRLFELAQITNLTAEEDELRLFRQEAKILDELSVLPVEKQRGLVKTYFSGENLIIQKKYEMNLTDLLGRKILPTNEYRFNLLSQLSDGLAQLHRMGITMGDIKPDNVMVNSKDSEAVYIDFGFAYRPESLINEGSLRPPRGTPQWMAPEILYRIWQGDSAAKKKENALKEDIFSHASLAVALYNGHESPPWHTACQRAILNHDYRTYYSCRGEFIERMIKNEATNERLSAFEHLIYRSVNPNPTLRPSAEQFAAGVRTIRKMMGTSQARHASEIEMISSKAELKAISLKDAVSQLSLKPVGAFILRRSLSDDPLSKADRIYCSYVDSQGIRHKIIAHSSANSESFQPVLQFLMEIGTLKEQVLL